MGLLKDLVVKFYGNNYISDVGKNDISSNEFYMPEYQNFMNKVKSGHYTYNNYPCPICGEMDFLTLSDSDFYFLPCGLAICRVCGLVQLSFRMSAPNYEEYYESGEYQKLGMDGIDNITLFYYEYKLMAQSFLDFFKESKTPLHKLVIYEIGCGSGGNLLRLSEQGAKVAGCDVDSQRVESGRNRYNLNLTVRSAEGLTKDVLKGYNIVLLSNVLEHLHQPQNFLSHLHQIIQPDTRLVVDVPNISNVACYTKGRGFAPFVHLGHIWYFSLQSLTNLMHRTGFQLQSAPIRGAAFTSLWQLAEPKDDIISDFTETLVCIRMTDSALLQTLYKFGINCQSLAGWAYIPYNRSINQSSKINWVKTSNS